jgi:PAS domain S-box-containing protein
VPEHTNEGHGFRNDVSPTVGLRQTGLDVVGPVPWGSHFCQFYQSKQDLLDILVPYFRAGLENNECCMWVTSHPLSADEATVALASAVPDFDRRIAAGQIEILDYRQWYVLDGKFDADRVFQGWVDKLTAALHRGFEGLRLSGNMFWLQKSLWKDFSDYEATIDRVIGQYRMLALCAYSLEKCGVFEVMDVVRNHQFTLIRQGRKWEILQSMQRQAAESALRESEQRYRTLFSAMSEGFALHEIIWDPEGRPCDYRFLEVNAAFERQTGLKAAELVGRTVREVLPDVEPMWIEQYGRVALTGQPARFEARSRSPGRCYDVRAFQAAPGRCAVVFADITERKQAEEAVQSLALFPEQNSSPVLRVGRDGTLLYANASSADLLAAWDCRPGQAIPAEMCRHVECALDAGEATEVEIPCATVTYSLSIAPIASEDYANLYGRDITERKDADRALRESEEQLRHLNDQLEQEVQAQTEELRDTIDRLQDEVVRRVLAEGELRKHSQMLEAFFQHTITPLAFMDKYFNFVRVNEAYARADGKAPEHFVGQNHFVLYPHAENRAIFEQVVRTGQPYFAHARPFRYPDDPQRVTYWDWQLTPLLNEAGDVQFLVLNLEDVTERQNAFHEIEHRARQLQKLAMELSRTEDRERKRLAEILHDDLQQQLAAAKFHLGILGSRVKGDGTLQEITGRVNDLLKEAIEESRSLSHELSPAVLHQGDLGETLEWLAHQVQTKHGLRVHVEVRDRVNSPSEAMKTFLYKAAQEILFNVVKHSRVKEATLRLQRVREQLWLTISDKGQGFDPRALGKTGGFGLLSIRERIELLGGRMKIKSAVGKGSTFLIAVPDKRMPEKTEGGWEVAGADATAPPIRQKTSAKEAGDRRLRVLLVDDHEVMREGLATLLDEQQDIEVVGQAGNGREAVDLAYRLQPDVVIMDAAMPVMAGDEATRQIKQHLPGTRVVALSMADEAAMAERMRRAGAESYLLKTAPSEELLAAIRAHE